MGQLTSNLWYFFDGSNLPQGKLHCFHLIFLKFLFITIADIILANLLLSGYLDAQNSDFVKNYCLCNNFIDA